MKFRAYVTVTTKGKPLDPPFWNRVMMGLDGDKTDMKNLITQLNFVKDDVNQFVANPNKIALRNLDIKIELGD
jgi:hypothetical protein